MAEKVVQQGGKNVVVDIVIHETPSRRPPRHPCEDGHRWAWAVLASGGERQVCYCCGTERG